MVPQSTNWLHLWVIFHQFAAETDFAHPRFFNAGLEAERCVHTLQSCHWAWLDGVPWWGFIIILGFISFRTCYAFNLVYRVKFLLLIFEGKESCHVFWVHKGRFMLPVCNFFCFDIVNRFVLVIIIFGCCLIWLSNAFTADVLVVFFADLSMESHKILMLYFRISNFTAFVRFFEEISAIYANRFIFENERFSYIFDFLLSE
jgi:hypothetical protein